MIQSPTTAVSVLLGLGVAAGECGHDSTNTGSSIED